MLRICSYTLEKMYGCHDFKKVWQYTTKCALYHSSISSGLPEQYSSHISHRAIDLAVNKVLTNDILQQLKCPGAIFCHDTKSCYDLIGHAQASISMQRLGVPKQTVSCHFGILQGATHQVWTAYGDSEFTYGGALNGTQQYGQL